MFDPNKGPALGVQGAWPFEELQLQQVRLLPTDNSTVESRRDVNLVREFEFLHAGVSLKAVPIIAANMFGTGTIPMAEVFHKHKMLVAMEKHTDVKSIAAFLKDHNGHTAIPSIGFMEQDGNNLQKIFEQAGDTPPRSIVLDVPNGHMEKMIDMIKHYRNKYPQTVIIAGNVATGSMARKIIEAGADVVKVGIGPGSACTTKMIAGTHRPQFAAVRECAQAVHELGGYVIADGGVRTAGDVAIALAAGGDFVMLGGVLAAHDESGQAIYIDDRGYECQEFMGSSSAAYMTRTRGEVARYRTGEGEYQLIFHKGSIEEPGAILQEILGGLRSALSYAGAHSISEFNEMAQRTYRGEEGGILLVKAEMNFSSGGNRKPSRIIAGRPNPITGEKPRPELIQA